MDQKSDTNDKSLKTTNKYHTVWHPDNSVHRAIVSHLEHAPCRVIILFLAKNNQFSRKKTLRGLRITLLHIYTKFKKSDIIPYMRQIHQNLYIIELTSDCSMSHSRKLFFFVFFSWKIFIAAQILGLYVYLPKVLYTINGYFLAG